MGDFVSPIVKYTSSVWDTVTNLKENLESLEVAMERLKQVYEDAKERVEGEEQLRRKRKRTNQVVGWFDRVQRMEAQVVVILQEGKEQEQEQEKCLGGRFPRNFLSRYKVGNKVSKMLDEVNELRTEGGFSAVTRDLGHAPVNEKPMEKTVGLELMVEEVWRCIEDTDLQTIGLYGLGGVGKTTLLKKLNNEFLNRSHGFVAVIWISVSKQPDLMKIRRNIRRQSQDLGEKKFVLLLDDIWERLDLAKLGVPIQYMQNGSKVLFTTRSLEICGLMEAQLKIKVECLTPEPALDLFRMKVGEDTLNSHPLIANLAEIMAAECKGLPLALITVGRAMASRKNPEEWEHAICILRNSPSQFPGMNDVLLLLKFSFDRLENDLLKSCFLYCSLFPEVKIEQLIELWIGEGFLGKSTDLYGRLINDWNKGEYVIGSLKLACLLESGESEEFVKMHQMICDMALLECRQRIKIYVKRGDQSTQAYGSGSWNKIERISLWDHSIEDLPINDSQLPNLLTLICKAPMLTTFPAGFFHLMPALTVLDLSKSFMLRGLPAEIAKLFNLQYLNLSETTISELPTELKNLTKLRCLLLEIHTHLNIPREMISNFQLLEVFSIRYCDEYLLDEFEHLQYISEISIVISHDTSLRKLFSSPKLQQCLKKLYFKFSEGLYSIEVSPSFLRRIEHLELIYVSLKELKISPETGSVRHHYFDNLCKVVICDCPILYATWLIYAPRLQHLTLTDCKFVKEVIGGNLGLVEIEENVDLFSSLTTLHLKVYQS